MLFIAPSGPPCVASCDAPTTIARTTAKTKADMACSICNNNNYQRLRLSLRRVLLNLNGLCPSGITHWLEYIARHSRLTTHDLHIARGMRAIWEPVCRDRWQSWWRKKSSWRRRRRRGAGVGFVCQWRVDSLFNYALNGKRYLNRQLLAPLSLTLSVALSVCRTHAI